MTSMNTTTTTSTINTTSSTYFTIAKPISRQEFLDLYKKITLLSHLIFAPVGIHDLLNQVIDDQTYVDRYQLIYQQIEDVISKLLFRLQGYDDDQIVATMHEFVGKNQDTSILQEIKTAQEVLRQIYQTSTVVEYDFTPSNILMELFTPSKIASILTNVLQFVHEFNILTGLFDLSNRGFDESIQNQLQINITKRLFNPMIDLKRPSYPFQDIFSSLFTSFTVTTDKSSPTLLTYAQYTMLLELYKTTDEIQEVFQHFATHKHIDETFLQSKKNLSSLIPTFEKTNNLHQNIKISLEEVQLGQYLNEFSIYADPLACFELIANDKLMQYEIQYEQETTPNATHDAQSTPTEAPQETTTPESTKQLQQQMKQLTKSLEFIHHAKDKLEEAKSAHVVGDYEEAVHLLTQDVLNKLHLTSNHTENEEQIDENEDLDQANGSLVIPTIFQIQLLHDRAKYYLNQGDIELALQDISSLLALDDHSLGAYEMRSQILLEIARLSQEEPSSIEHLTSYLEEIMSNTNRNCLASLFPTEIVSSTITSSDLLYHQAAEDSLLAFLLGGSSDINLAATAEEVARETCRKFSKYLFEQRKQTSGLPSQETTGSLNDVVPPRPWFVTSYFSGYGLLTAEFGLFGEVTLAKSSSMATEIHDIEQDHQQDSSLPQEIELIYPPDHLIQPEQGVLGQDIQAYSLLCTCVNLIEELLLIPEPEIPPIDETSDETTSFTTSTSTSTKDRVFQAIPCSDETTNSDELLTLFSQLSIEENIGNQQNVQLYELGCCDIHEKEFHFQNTFLQKNEEPNQQQTQQDVIESKPCEQILQIVKYFVVSEELTGLKLFSSGKIDCFTFEYPKHCYDKKKTNEKKAKKTKDTKKNGKKSEGNKKKKHHEEDEDEEDNEDDSVWEDMDDDEEDDDNFTETNSDEDEDSDEEEEEEEEEELTKEPETETIISYSEPISFKIRARLLSLYGSIAYLLGNALDAIACFEASLALDNDLLDTRIKLGALLIDMDEPKHAGILLQEANDRSDQSHPLVQLHLAELEIHNNHFQEAGTLLRQANRSIKDNRWSLPSISYAQAPYYVPNQHSHHHGSINQHQRTQTWLQTYEDKDEVIVSWIHSNIYALMGISNFRANPTRPEYAVSILDEGLTTYPNSIILSICLGEIHSQCGDLVKSIKLFERVTKLDAYHPLPWINAGRTYEQLGQHTHASNHILHALELDPTLAMARVDLAQHYRSIGALDQAVQTIDEAMKLARHVSEIRDVLTARYVTLLQANLVTKGLYTPPPLPTQFQK